MEIAGRTEFLPQGTIDLVGAGIDSVENTNPDSSKRYSKFLGFR
jgi:hypothetical protein